MDEAARAALSWPGIMVGLVVGVALAGLAFFIWYSSHCGQVPLFGGTYLVRRGPPEHGDRGPVPVRELPAPTRAPYLLGKAGEIDFACRRAG